MSEQEVSDGIYAGEFAWIGMVREDLQALLASSFPVKPPSTWFQNPNLKMPTPLTITNDGHVMGHIATWKQSHIGLAGSVKAPKSRSNYAFFATGVVECDDGSHVNVGNITLTGGHAPLEASVTDVVAHYDNTDSAVMDVAIGEDKHGIWVAGALRPEVTDSQLRKIRASGVSGDWRPINGNLELVAACCVNVPGFPIPRAMVSSGKITALTAAGTGELVQIRLMEHMGSALDSSMTASLGGINERLSYVEASLLGKTRDRRQDPTLNTAVTKAKQLATVRASAAPRPVRKLTERERIERRQSENLAITAAAIRARVKPDLPWEDGYSIDMTTQECLVASLRAKAKGLTAGGGKWDSEAREKASKSGVALPDGSFPIRDRKDWENARRALGRAKNRTAAIRHIRKRGRVLGVSKELVESVGKAA